MSPTCSLAVRRSRLLAAAAVLCVALHVGTHVGAVAGANGDSEAEQLVGMSRRSGWEWMGRDAFDEFIDEFDAVRADNCHDNRGARMPTDTVSQTLAYNNILPVRDAFRAAHLHSHRHWHWHWRSALHCCTRTQCILGHYILAFQFTNFVIYKIKSWVVALPNLLEIHWPMIIYYIDAQHILHAEIMLPYKIVMYEYR